MSRIGNWWATLETKHRIAIVMPILVVLVTIVGWVVQPLLVGLINDSPTPSIPAPVSGTKSPGVATPMRPTVCPPAGEPGVKQVYASENDILADPISYRAKAEDHKVFLAAGGEFKSRIPPGQHFYALWAADAATADMRGKHGDGVYRKFQNFDIIQNCWGRSDETPMPNDNTVGLTYHIRLILVDDAHLSAFMDSQHTGFDDNRLNKLHVTQLAHFAIPTKGLQE